MICGQGQEKMLKIGNCLWRGECLNCPLSSPRRRGSSKHRRLLDPRLRGDDDFVFDPRFSDQSWPAARGGLSPLRNPSSCMNVRGLMGIAALHERQPSFSTMTPKQRRATQIVYQAGAELRSRCQCVWRDRQFLRSCPSPPPLIALNFPWQEHLQSV